MNSLLGTIGTAWGWPAVENDWLADQIHPVFPKSKSRNMSDFEIVNQLNLFWNSALHGATWCDYIYIYMLPFVQDKATDDRLLRC